MPPWARLAMGLMVVFAVVFVFGNLRSGVVTLRGGARIDRRDQPVTYWMLIAANVFVVVILAGLVLPAGSAAH